MTTSTEFDRQMTRVGAGERLSPDEIRDLDRSPDLLTLGMLADAAHRRLHETKVTYLRMAVCAVDASFAGAMPPAAQEIRITGRPATLAAAVAAVQAARAVAATRRVSGFSWTDVQRLAGEDAAGVPGILHRLREAGLDAVAELPLDAIAEPVAAIEQLVTAGFGRLRLTIGAPSAGERMRLFQCASDLRERFDAVQALNPLPSMLDAFRPTTGYEDVKAVAMARLAAPTMPTIQVDWRRYGPKLAQVALTFGADDVDGISALDESPEGRRRAPVEEIRRNIEAAGFVAVERDGRFAALS